MLKLGKIALLFLGMVAVLAACGSFVYRPTVKELQQHLKNVVAVMTTGYCSGWVLRGTHEIVTAAHCAEGMDDSDLIGVDFGDGTLHPFHIRKRGDMELGHAPDIMTLYTNDRTINWPVGFEVCKFKPYYGEDVLLMGGPLRFSKSLEFGKVANPDVDVSNVFKDNAPFAKHMIEFNGEMWPGNSGGPVIDLEKGCVIGAGELVRLAPSDGFASAPVGVNFLTPMSDLEKVDNG